MDIKLKYYKIIDDNKFICVASSAMLARFQNKHQIMLFCGIDEAQYIITDKGVYHALWMVPEPSIKKGQYKTVEIIEITEDEYNTLREVDEYEILPELEIQEENQEKNFADAITQSTLDYVIEKKILQMETATKNVIAAGYKKIPYHADGQLCKYFSADDVESVIEAATNHIEKYTTYYNALHYWILSLNDIEEINNIYFGIEIPDEYKSEVLKS